MISYCQEGHILFYGLKRVLILWAEETYYFIGSRNLLLYIVKEVYHNMGSRSYCVMVQRVHMYLFLILCWCLVSTNGFNSHYRQSILFLLFCFYCVLLWARLWMVCGLICLYKCVRLIFPKKFLLVCM